MSGSTVSLRFQQAFDVTPLSVTPLQGGCIADVFQITLPPKNPWDAATVVTKFSASEAGHFELEGYMLNYLRQHSQLPIPEVYFMSHEMLVLAWCPGKSQFSKKAEQHAAELLASLHQIKGPSFGLEQDTLIGGLHQPNPWTESWLTFFREHRILHMAHTAFAEKKLSLSLLNRLERFCDQLEQWLSEPAYPALLHGDVWTTNMLAQQDRITAFLDPAIYYGHAEIELAFTTLFGSFGPSFFDRYGQIHPIEPDFFEIRRDLYNLYPLLVHVRLFGAGYTQSIDKILSRIGY